MSLRGQVQIYDDGSTCTESINGSKRRIKNYYIHKLMKRCLNHLFSKIMKKLFIGVELWDDLMQCKRTIARNHSQLANLKFELRDLVKDDDFLKA